VALEAIQLLIPTRASGPIDMAANTLGTAIGVLAFWALTRISRPTA
jgi:VanZ family protein